MLLRRAFHVKDILVPSHTISVVEDPIETGRTEVIFPIHHWRYEKELDEVIWVLSSCLDGEGGV